MLRRKEKKQYQKENLEQCNLENCDTFEEIKR